MNRITKQNFYGILSRPLQSTCIERIKGGDNLVLFVFCWFTMFFSFFLLFFPRVGWGGGWWGRTRKKRKHMFICSKATKSSNLLIKLWSYYKVDIKKPVFIFVEEAFLSFPECYPQIQHHYWQPRVSIDSVVCYLQRIWINNSQWCDLVVSRVDEDNFTSKNKRKAAKLSPLRRKQFEPLEPNTLYH